MHTTSLTPEEIAASLQPSPRSLSRANEATGLKFTALAYRGYHAIGRQVENAAEGRPYTLAEYEELGRKADAAADAAIISFRDCAEPGRVLRRLY